MRRKLSWACALAATLIGCGPSRITVDTTRKLQEMQGWEALVNPPAVECDRRSSLAAMERILDLAVHDAGINRVRLPVRAGTEHPRDPFPARMREELSFDEWKKTWHVAVNDNADPRTADTSGFHWGYFDYTVETMVLPLRDRLRSKGEDLWINLILPSAGPGGLYQGSAGEEYAELITAAFLHLRERYGLIPQSLEIINEPKVRAWTMAEVAQALLAVRARLAQHGFHPRFLAPSATTIDGSEEYLRELLRFPGVREALTDVSYHRYGGGKEALQRLAGIADSLGFGMAMTEKMGATTETLREDLTVGGVSTWQQFGLTHCGKADRVPGSGVYVTFREVGDTSARTVQLTGNARYLRHYFRHVRLGAHLVTSSSSGSVHATAFENPDGRIVVVLESDRADSATIAGLPAGTYRQWWTTADGEGTAPDSTIAAGGRLSARLPGAGTLTVFAR
jgi:hypothetical protein